MVLDLTDQIKANPPVLQVNWGWDAVMMQWCVETVDGPPVWYTVIHSEGLRRCPYWSCVSLTMKGGRQAAREWWLLNRDRSMRFARKLMCQHKGDVT